MSSGLPKKYSRLDTSQQRTQIITLASVTGKSGIDILFRGLGIELQQSVDSQYFSRGTVPARKVFRPLETLQDVLKFRCFGEPLNC
jgi:hypothetical protein